MRVRSKVNLAPTRSAAAWLAVAAAFVSACSSTPIDEPAAGDAAPPSSGGGTGNVVPSGGGATVGAAAPVYQKQDYPAGPYGVGLHATLENFSFLGWHDPKSANYDVDKLEHVQLSEYYNPDGRSNVKLIWINASAVWCSVCRAEMSDINTNQVHAAFGPKGVQMLVTLFEDNDSGPAKPLDLKNWASLPQHSIDYPLVLDPGFKLGAFFTSDATPLNMLVDARTMKVLDATMGYSSGYWERVDRLLAKLP